MGLSKEMKQEIGDCKYAFQVRDGYGYRIDFDDQSMCNHCRWVEGAYGNMKIYKQQGENCSDIFLFTEKQQQKLGVAFFRYISLYHITQDIFNGDFKTKVLLKFYKRFANKIV